MAKIIPLPANAFAHLLKSERVEAKLLLYRRKIQETVKYIREKHGMENPLSLPSLAHDALPAYARHLAGEEWANLFRASENAIDVDWISNYWLYVLCVFTKHHVLLSPRLLEEYTDEDAYDSLKKDHSARWDWEERCRAIPDYDDMSIDLDEFMEMKQELLDEQYEVAKRNFAAAKKRYESKSIVHNEDCSPFLERIVRSTPHIVVSMKLNKVRLSLNSRATKDDMLNAWKHVERCQKLIKEGKRKTPKHDDRMLDIYNDVASLMLKYETEGLNGTQIAKKINDDLKMQKIRSYDGASMSKVMQRVRNLGF